LCFIFSYNNTDIIRCVGQQTHNFNWIGGGSDCTLIKKIFKGVAGEINDRPSDT